MVSVFGAHAQLLTCIGTSNIAAGLLLDTKGCMMRTGFSTLREHLCRASVVLDVELRHHIIQFRRNFIQWESVRARRCNYTRQIVRVALFRRAKETKLPTFLSLQSTVNANRYRKGPRIVL
jgi:hypothetical protein